LMLLVTLLAAGLSAGYPPDSAAERHANNMFFLWMLVGILVFAATMVALGIGLSMRRAWARGILVAVYALGTTASAACIAYSFLSGAIAIPAVAEAGLGIAMLIMLMHSD